MPAMIAFHPCAGDCVDAKEAVDGKAPWVPIDSRTSYFETDGRVHIDRTDQAYGYELVHVGYMMHPRRKFYGAHIGANKKGQAKEGLRFIKGIYRVERELRAANLPEQTFVVERRKAAAIFRKFNKWLKVTSGTVPDESLLGKAISYTLTEFKRRVRYLKYAYLTPDNGIAERAIRPYAVGRRNWPFNNTPLGAHAGAAMYSLVQTAIANNLDPYHFLWRLFTELPEADTKEKLEKLMPWNMEGIPRRKPLPGKN